MYQSNRREIFSQSESKEFCQPIIFLHQVKEQHLSICKCSMGKSGQHNCVRHLLQCYVPYLLIFVVKSCSSISFSWFFRICERLGCGPIQFGCQKLQKKKKKIKLGQLGWVSSSLHWLILLLFLFIFLQWSIYCVKSVMFWNGKKRGEQWTPPFRKIIVVFYHTYI